MRDAFAYVYLSEYFHSNGSVVHFLVDLGAGGGSTVCSLWSHLIWFADAGVWPWVPFEDGSALPTLGRCRAYMFGYLAGYALSRCE